MSLTLVAFKIEQEPAKQFQEACAEYGLNKSKFLRACVDKFLNANNTEREELLELLGFKRRVQWTR